jgi:hypothetical protein
VKPETRVCDYLFPCWKTINALDTIEKHMFFISTSLFVVQPRFLQFHVDSCWLYYILMNVGLLFVEYHM